MVKWDDLAPMMEFEAKERKEARDFAERMTGSGPVWRQIGYGALIGILALMILGGSGLLFYEVLFAAEGFDPSTKAGIIEIIKAIAVLVVGFFFGSSASSRGKDQAIADQAARR